MEFLKVLITSLVPPTSTKDKSKTAIVIVGGGAGGLATASQLVSNFKDQGDVLIIEPSEKHYYQPLWTLVGGGLAKKEDSQRNESELIPKGARWERDAVVKYLPEENKVLTKTGKSIDYDYLVVATGIQLYWDRVKGLREALGKRGVTSNYSFETVGKTFEMIKDLKKDSVAIFTFPNTPIKCGGAPQKILWLADDYWRNHGGRNGISVHFNTAGVSMFAVKKYSDALDILAKKRDITQNFKHNLVEVRGETNEAVFDVDGKQKVVKYDFLHVTPPMGPSDEIKNSPLADPVTGYVTVDKNTLQHTKYPNVFSLGDCSNLPTSKTAAAITRQAPVLVANLIAHHNGEPLKATYNGYTSCPITTSARTVMLAEFKYGNEIAETFPWDQSQESYFAMGLKKYIFPPAYWEGLLAGRWFGPNLFINPTQCPVVKKNPTN